MISSTIRPWAMVTIMTAIMALSCSGGGQGGSGFEDSPTDRIFMVAPSQELDCGHVQDMEMMAASNSTPSLQDRGVSP